MNDAVSSNPPVSAGYLGAQDIAALSAARSNRWRPGLAAQGKGASHSEVFASGREAGGVAAAFALALDDLRSAPANDTAPVSDDRPILWVQDRAAIRLGGRPYRAGLPPQLRHRVIHVAADKAEDLLFALEEGLRCRDLAFVVGEVAGNPRALNFTASRRLSLAAEKHGVPLWLVRLDAAHDLSSARLRWDIRSAASSPPEWNAEAPGTPTWHADLFRARAHAPGQWILSDDGKKLAASRPARKPATRTIVGQAYIGDLAGQAVG